MQILRHQHEYRRPVFGGATLGRGVACGVLLLSCHSWVGVEKLKARSKHLQKDTTKGNPGWQCWPIARQTESPGGEAVTRRTDPGSRPQRNRGGEENTRVFSFQRGTTAAGEPCAVQGHRVKFHHLTAAQRRARRQAVTGDFSDFLVLPRSWCLSPTRLRPPSKGRLFTRVVPRHALLWIRA